MQVIITQNNTILNNAKRYDCTGDKEKEGVISETEYTTTHSTVYQIMRKRTGHSRAKG